MVSLPKSPRHLSARQQQLLQRIAQFIAQHGRPPTRADLARAMGLRNRQGIDQHLRALERKGYLELEPAIARGLRLVDSAALRDALHGTSHSTSRGASHGTSHEAARGTLLPLYGRVAAGMPTFAPGNLEEEISIDQSLFRPRADFLLRVHGQSMRDAGIAHRDILAVHRTVEAANGQIVVARLNEEATVKIYRRKGFRLRLEPANPEFTPIEIDLRHEPWRIEGIVVGVLRTELLRQPPGM
jgi:repressor LexA